MITGAMRKDTHREYRLRLEQLLNIPTHASDQDIHDYIEAGFLPDCVVTLCSLGAIGTSELNQIISLRRLKNKMATRQRLTLHESDRAFRLAHITALTMAILASDDKARRWLSKPKARFSGKSPLALLSTIQGTRLVEEMLLEVADAF